MKKIYSVFMIVICFLWPYSTLAITQQDPDELRINEEQIQGEKKMQDEIQLQNEKENRIIVKYKNRVGKQGLFIQGDLAGISKRTAIGYNLEVIQAEDHEKAEILLEEMKNNPAVELAEFDCVRYILGDIQGLAPKEADQMQSLDIPVNDTYFRNQWGLEYVRIPQVWRSLVPKKSIVVGVIDTGLELTHEDFQGRFAPDGYNFVDDNYNINDVNGHGTFVSGIIAATADNNKGIAGAAGTYDVKILPLQAGTPEGKMYSSDMIAAINYAIEKEVDIINISFGGTEYLELENNVIQEAVDRGILVVAAAGNSGNTEYLYPASYPNVISVGSVAENGQISSFSNHNDQVDLAAPGERIYSTSKTNTYKIGQGTSYSTPLIAGAAALLKAANSALSGKEIAMILTATARDMGPTGKDNYFGYGLLDAMDAVQMAQADIEPDGIIDLLDIARCAQDYGAIGDSPYDLNTDGIVDIFDLIKISRLIEK
jgi:subtilisin family serine protease